MASVLRIAKAQQDRVWGFAVRFPSISSKYSLVRSECRTACVLQEKGIMIFGRRGEASNTNKSEFRRRFRFRCFAPTDGYCSAGCILVKSCEGKRPSSVSLRSPAFLPFASLHGSSTGGSANHRPLSREGPQSGGECPYSFFIRINEKDPHQSPVRYTAGSSFPWGKPTIPNASIGSFPPFRFATRIFDLGKANILSRPARQFHTGKGNDDVSRY
jgi:hypothetical protein